MLTLTLALLLAQDSRLPVPSSTEQKDVRELVRQLFKDDFSSRDPKTREALAGKLLAQSEDASNDDVTRYVLLTEARDVAVLAGAVDTLVRALDLLGRKYRFDGEDAIDALDDAGRRLRTVEANGALTQAYLDLVHRELDANRYDTALTAARKATTAARKARNPVLLEEASSLSKEIPALKKIHSEAQAAELKLSLDPDDPGANLAYGEYLCFHKDNWKQGIPLLSKGSDSGLKKVAALEIAVTDAPDARVTVGDGWWDLASSTRGSARDLYRARALHWYEQALPAIEGLSKLRLEKRVDELREEMFKAGGRGRVIDLLRLFDPAKHVVAGSWELRRGELHLLEAGTYSRTRFPMVPKGSYDLDLAFTRTSGHRSMSIVLPIADTSAMAVLSWATGGDRHYSGIHEIRGRTVQSNPSGKPDSFVLNRRYAVSIRVRLLPSEGVNIDILLDGKPHVSWQGPVAALSQERRSGIPAPVSLGWSTNQSVMVIHSARLRMANGRAEPWR